MFGYTKKFITTLAMVCAVLALFASPASAIELDFEAGGNGPDIDPPTDINDIIVVPVSTSASVEVNCATETGTARFENPTADFIIYQVEVDGTSAGGGLTHPNTVADVDFALVENQTVNVQVTTGPNVLLDEDVTLDCLLPDPSYEVLSDCDDGQAHVRLVNNGDDVANMAVQYDGASYALQAVAPHSSLDWLLAASPGESTDFTVKFGHDVDLGTESFTFDCPEEPGVQVLPPVVPPVEPPVTPPVEPPATPPASTTTTTDPAASGPATQEGETSAAADAAVEEATSQDAEDIAEDVEGSDDQEDTSEKEGEDLDLAIGTIDDKTGSSLGKIATGGFALVLLIAGMAGIAYYGRKEMLTA